MRREPARWWRDHLDFFGIGEDRAIPTEKGMRNEQDEAEAIRHAPRARHAGGLSFRKRDVTGNNFQGAGNFVVAAKLRDGFLMIGGNKFALANADERPKSVTAEKGDPE